MMTSPGRSPALWAGDPGSTWGTRMPALTAGKDASVRRSCSALAASSCSILIPMYGLTTRPCACSCATPSKSEAARPVCQRMQNLIPSFLGGSTQSRTRHFAISQFSGIKESDHPALSDDNVAGAHLCRAYLRGDVLCSVDGDGKRDAIRHNRLHGGYADHLSIQVHQRPARITAVGGRICLDVLCVWPSQAKLNCLQGSCSMTSQAAYAKPYP